MEQLPDPAVLLEELLSLRAAIDREAAARMEVWQRWIARASYVPSARNLAEYLALRSRDLRELQAELALWGLSSLGRSESRVMANVDAVIASLGAIANDREAVALRPSLEVLQAGAANLATNSDALLGPRNTKQRVRIMVTLSTESAADLPSIESLVDSGMDCARINCAHDDESVWDGMIANVRRAAHARGRTCAIHMDLPGPRLRIEATRASRSRVRSGNVMALRAGSAAVSETEEPPLAPFEIWCAVTPLFSALAPGHRMYIDGGKIDAVVASVAHDHAMLRVTRTAPKGGRLVAGKGLNFPDTPLNLGALTDDDLRALDYAVTRADTIGYSFVQSRDDIVALQEALRARLPEGARMPGLIAKIETRRALQQLPEIIVQAAGSEPFGVMIARGDLAVEIGYERLAEIQEEMLWLCEAAHVPVVWATQVLERLVTKGTPTRAEMTDAAMAARAECVMLNKGPFVAQGVAVLANVLARMEGHQTKKSPQLRSLAVWNQRSDAASV